MKKEKLKQNVILKRLRHIQKRVLPKDETNLDNIIFYPQIYHANVIKLNGKIVGYLVWKEEHHFLKEPTAYISSFAILPEYQNKGYGSKLLLLTLNQIKKKGIKPSRFKH